jgi:phospholipid/cholesterol/gamma-HCH transport system permease protein
MDEVSEISPALRTVDRRVATGLVRLLEAVGELAMLFFRTLRAVLAWHVPVGETIRQMNVIGVSSIPIAIIVVGSSAAVLALYTAQQFVQFGQGNLIGSVTALAVAREVAPVLTAVLVAARVGAAIAAELGTMAVTEQVDALRALAVSPIHYLVVPRFLGATLIMPIVTLLAGFGGMFGAQFVAVATAGISAADFWHSAGTIDSMDIVKGLTKTIVFGAIVSLVGCWQGLRTRGGAAGVGRSTTASVVISTVLVYITNYYLAKLLFGGQRISLF